MLYVACLYLLLGSPHHNTREFASREFQHRVSGWPHLYGAFAADKLKTTPCPERRHRLIRPVLAYRSHLAATFTPTGIPVWPVADCLPDADGNRDRTTGGEWMRRAKLAGFGAKVEQVEYSEEGIPYVVGEPWHSVGLSGPAWYDWRRGTEYMARTMIRDGADPEAVCKLLQEMWRLELKCESDSPGRRGELESWKEWQGGYPAP